MGDHSPLTRPLHLLSAAAAFSLALLVPSCGGAPQPQPLPTPPSPTATASNRSKATACAEEDNVDVTLTSQSVTSFSIEATHPTYSLGADNCAANFATCSVSSPGFPFAAGVLKLFDNGESVVLYMDGNLRLIPQPPPGVAVVCFGSSVIVGPATLDARPLAEIGRVEYAPDTGTLQASYVSGDTATLRLERVDRTATRARLTLTQSPGQRPFATLRSMLVAEGNADVDHVRWTDPRGVVSDQPVTAFPGGEGVEWFFYRATRSVHNTSAPDIRITLR